MRKVVVIMLVGTMIFSAVVGSVAAGWLPNQQHGSPSEQPAIEPRPAPSSESESKQPETTEKTYPKPYLDLDYDDSWVANVPEVIGGYTVIGITTPKTVACSSAPKITLLALQKSMDDFLSDPPDVRSLRTAIRSLPGVPFDFTLSFANNPADEEEYEERRRRSNETKIRDGCIFFERVITGPETQVVPAEGSVISDVELR